MTGTGPEGRCSSCPFHLEQSPPGSTSLADCFTTGANLYSTSYMMHTVVSFDRDASSFAMASEGEEISEPLALEFISGTQILVTNNDQSTVTRMDVDGVGCRSQNNIALVIGDGFACMGSLLLQSGFAKKVIMVNLTKTLFVDVTHAMTLPELAKNKSMVLVNNESDLKNAVQNDNSKMIFIEALNCEILNVSEADLVFNIASMQEMDMKYINIYFGQMRKIAQKKSVYFYCCNRASKIFPDKTLIEFSAYPWKDQDKHYFDELCPWHQDYYRLIPKFYFPYDGPIIHRFTKLSA